MTDSSLGPLYGLVADAAGQAEVIAELAGLLRLLGARVDVHAGPGPGRVAIRASVTGTRGAASLSDTVAALPGLPSAVPARAAGALLALAAVLSLFSGREVTVDAADVAVMLLLPVVMAVGYGAPQPTRRAPLACHGGLVAAELGAPGDAETFELLLSNLPEDASVREVCDQAQTWRLPVVPYLSAQDRAAQGGWSAGPLVAGTEGRWGTAPPSSGPGSAEAPLAGMRVVDLTVMWAGPLATWLLAGLGAQVTTIEPSIRPDGSRASQGGGIYPGGVLVPGDGTRSAMFNAFSDGKDRRDLDLRRPADITEFNRLLDSADVLVDNLSPRARAQLGIAEFAEKNRNPALVAVSLPAFGVHDRHRSWVAYGSLVHAISGLALPDPLAEPVPAATAYPDPLAGIIAALAAVAGLWGRDAGWRPSRTIEVPLAATVAGLKADSDRGLMLQRDPTELARDLIRDRGDLFRSYAVGGESLPHPRIPFVMR